MRPCLALLPFPLEILLNLAVPRRRQTRRLAAGAEAQVFETAMLLLDNDLPVLVELAVQGPEGFAEPRVSAGSIEEGQDVDVVEELVESV